MPTVRIRPAAQVDLAGIWEYIAEDNIDAADRFVRRIDEVYHRLAEHPKIGRRREELVSDLRSFPVGDYVIFYKPQEGGIIVVRILHSAQDIRSSMLE